VGTVPIAFYHSAEGVDVQYRARRNGEISAPLKMFIRAIGRTSDRDRPVGLAVCLPGGGPVDSGVMADVTRILNAAEGGDPAAAGQLLPLVYDELRKLAAERLARERPGQTLQATALVHEAYLRLVGADAAGPWHGRGHFFAAAAEAMRRIL